MRTGAARILMTPDKPCFTAHGLLVAVSVAPVVAAGALTGSWLLPRMNQKLFDSAILALAAVAAVKLIFG